MIVLHKASWRERKCPNFVTVTKGDSNPDSLDCESGVLSLSYRAPSISHLTHPEQSYLKWCSSMIYTLPRRVLNFAINSPIYYTFSIFRNWKLWRLRMSKQLVKKANLIHISARACACERACARVHVRVRARVPACRRAGGRSVVHNKVTYLYLRIPA